MRASEREGKEASRCGKKHVDTSVRIQWLRRRTEWLDDGPSDEAPCCRASVTEIRLSELSYHGVITVNYLLSLTIV